MTDKRRIKKAAAAVSVIVTIVLIYAIAGGFRVETSAYISDFAVSDTGSEMTVHISVASSVGYVRKVVPHVQSDGRLCIDCYSAFGGINGSLGARSEYTLRLEEDTDTIAVRRSEGRYDDVLKKGNDGNWHPVR